MAQPAQPTSANIVYQPAVTLDALSKSGFNIYGTDKAPAPTIFPKINAQVIAMEKSGKSRFGMLMPNVAYLCFDGDGARFQLEAQAKKGRVIAYKNYNVDKRLTDLTINGAVEQPHYIDLWKTIESDMVNLLRCKQIRSLVIDRWDTLYEIVRYALFGQLKQVKGGTTAFEASNRELGVMLNMVKAHDKNLILLNGNKKQWAADSEGKQRPTGKLEPMGWEHTGFCVENVLNLEYSNGMFSMKIVRSYLATANGNMLWEGAVVPPSAGNVTPTDDPPLVKLKDEQGEYEETDWWGDKDDPRGIMPPHPLTNAWIHPYWLGKLLYPEVDPSVWLDE